MKANSDYFDYSLKNPDDLLDFSNPEGSLVINKDAEEDATPLVAANDELINLITTYKTIRNDPSFSNKSKDNIIARIIHILENTEHINYSPFCVYFQVLNYPFSTFMSDKANMNLNQTIKLMKEIVNFYIDNRHDLYLYHGYSNQALQVMSDSASSRRNGVTGINKIKSYLDSNGFKHVKNYGELSSNNKCYILPDKGDKQTFDLYLNRNSIAFTFRQERQNKYPDLLIKINRDIYIIEQKITNGSGGAQNEALNEIIEFVQGREHTKTVHYISCLQGNYFTRLHDANEKYKPGARENKEIHQLNQIRKHLNECLSNFFVNENGLEKLLSDLVEESNDGH